MDLRSFPRFGNISWLRGELGAGDILFIPHSYWHQVAREALSKVPQVNSEGRNLAINIWHLVLWSLSSFAAGGATRKIGDGGI